MKVPFNPINRRTSEPDLAHLQKELAAILNKGRFLFGPLEKKFEISMAEYLCVEPEHITACHSGTDAIILGLLCLNVGPGDEVITSTNTALPTASAICSVGAIPVFADIEADSWLLDLESLKEKITDRTKVVIPVHLYGNVCDIEKIRLLLKAMGREDIKILEDVAHAQGSMWQNRHAGTLADFSAFSFFPTKNLGAAGDGGAVYCSTQIDSKKVKALTNYGQVDRFIVEHARGLNSRLGEIQAMVLLQQLQILNNLNAKKSDFMNYYKTNLANCPIAWQKVEANVQPAWHLAVIKVQDNSIRNDLKKFLTLSEIEVMLHYPKCLHKLSIPNNFNQLNCQLPVAEDHVEKILSIPLSPYHTRDEVDFVIDKILHYFNR